MRQLGFGILTISDTRSLENDSSGDYLASAVGPDRLVARHICRDDTYAIRAILSDWIYDERIHVVMTTGGTGFAVRDVTTKAAQVLFDKTIPGFGELFRSISFSEIGSSSLQSCAIAGLANETLVFCLPGSPSGCKTAWEKIIQLQLDEQHKPCNFVRILWK